MKKKKILSEIKKGTLFLKDVDDKLKADEEVVLESVKFNGLYLKFADKKLKASKKIVLAAVKQNGMSIYFASNKLKADEEIAQEAVKNNCEALEYVDSKLKDSLKNIDDQKSGSLLYKLVGQEITIFNQVFNVEDFKIKSKIKKNINDFIKEAEQSSSSMPVLGILDKNFKKIKKEKSELLDEKNSDTKYEIKNIGDLYKKPTKGKILMVYYYQYLSTEYDLEFLKKRNKIVFDINNFNGFAVFSEKNKDLAVNNESSDKPSDTYIEVILSSGKKLSYTSSEQKKLIKDLENTNL
tara:strand:- start:311 stop:1195 length:885 start_codon:yes stop_codon:yes gene_type:complete